MNATTTAVASKARLRTMYDAWARAADALEECQEAAEEFRAALENVSEQDLKFDDRAGLTDCGQEHMDAGYRDCLRQMAQALGWTCAMAYGLLDPVRPVAPHEEASPAPAGAS